MTLRDIRYRVEYIVFRTLVCLLMMLNVRQTVQWAECLAWLFVRILPHKLTRYDVAHENIKAAFPGRFSPAETEAIIRQMWVHLFRMVAETVQMSRKVVLENSREVIVFRNRKAAVAALSSGRPVLLLGGHFGNWETSAAAFGMFGFPLGVVARQLDNPYLHRWFLRAREEFGHKLILKRGGWEELVELLDKGGNVGLLGDQDAGRRGVFVEFFGRPASTFKSIALMALEYRALIVVGYGRRLPDDLYHARWARFEVGCEEVIDAAAIDATDPVREITERYTRALERAVRRSVEQYFWVHRRWKTAPVERRKGVGRAA